MVNSDAQEVERTVVTRSDRSARHETTAASATGGFHVPLTVGVGGAGNMWSVSRAVPTQVSSGQTVVSRPPLGWLR